MNRIQRLAIIASGIVVAGAAHAQKYTITPLDPPGSSVSEATSINEHGWVSMRARIGDDERAFVFDGSQYIPIPFIGFQRNFAIDVNDLGQVTGSGWTTNSNFSQRVYLFDPPNTVQNLGSSRAFNAFPEAINNSAQIVGADGINAWVWSASSLFVILPTLGGTGASARDINEWGEIVGRTSDGVNLFGTFWDAQHQPFSIGSLGPEGSTSGAEGINDWGDIAGYFATSAGSNPPIRAAVVREGVMEDFGTAGRTGALALDINNHGEMVGYAYGTPAPNAVGVVWRPDGSYSNLYDQFRDQGWVVVQATAINDKGQIVGYGTFNGKQVGFRLDPLPPAGQVTGTVELSQYVGHKGGIPITVRVLKGGALQEEIASKILEDGSVRFATALRGTFDIQVQGHTFLSQTLSGVTITDSGATGLNWVLTNGDCDGSNFVDLDDYFTLADAYRTERGDPNWDRRADLDGSNFVDLDDYFILADAYRLGGS